MFIPSNSIKKFNNHTRYSSIEIERLIDIWLGWHKTWEKAIYILVHWDITWHYTVRGETVLWVHELIVSLFHKSTIDIVTDFEREFHMEALCVVLVCMVVIYLEGGFELAVALLSSIARRNSFSKYFFCFQVSTSYPSIASLWVNS